MKLPSSETARAGRMGAGRTNSIQPSRGYQGAIPLEGHCVHCPAVALLLQQASAGRGIPQAPGCIKAGSGQQPAPGVPGHAAQPICVARQHPHFLLPRR